MSRCVPAHAWADAARGALDAAARARMDDHAAGCARCAAARDRIAEARVGFAAIRAREPEGLRWDHIGARVHWVISAERRAAERRAPRRRLVRVAVAVAFAGAAAGSAAALWFSVEAGVRAPTAAAPATTPAPAPTAERRAPRPHAGVVTLAQGEVRVDGAPLAVDASVRAGAILETAPGARVVVQFGPERAFAVGPDSRVELARFDDALVDLAVRGRVDVSLRPLDGDAAFRVTAGARRVEVRGTVFRVDHRDDALEVTCTRGHVVVVDGEREHDVRGGQQLALAALAAPRYATAQPIDPAGLADLERALDLPTVPVWQGAQATLRDSATLDVTAEPGQSVRVDGVDIGGGSFSLRVAPGRHQVDGAWLRLTSGAREVVGSGPPGPPGAADEDNVVRARQLRRALDRHGHRLDACVARLREAGVAEGTFVDLRIGLYTDGSVEYLNIIDTNAPTVARCVRGVLDRVEFPPGPAGSVRRRIAW